MAAFSRVPCLGRMEGQSVILLGSSFVVEGDRLITAAHVVGAGRDLVAVLPRTASLNDYQDTTTNQIQTVPVEVIRVCPFRDVAVLKLVGVTDAGLWTLESADGVPVGEAVDTVSFPHAPDGRFVMTHHRSHIGAKFIAGTEAGNFKHLILNLQARPGQSGAPVIRLSNQRVVGMLIGGYRPPGSWVEVAGVNPSTLHQTTYILAVDHIMELL